MKQILYLFCLSAALLLSSCTAVDNETIVGTWNLDKYYYMGKQTIDDGMNMISSSYFELDEEKYPDAYTHLTFNSDGTGVLQSNYYDADNVLTSEENHFNWTLEDGGLYMTTSDGKPVFKANGFKATLSGSKLYLEKTVKDDKNDYEENMILYRISE